MPHVNKKFCSLTEFFHKSISRSLEKIDINKKLLSFRSSSFCSAFCFISCIKIHSNKIDFKKDFSNTPLRVVKRQLPITIQILGIVNRRAPKKIAVWEADGGY